MFGTVWIGSVGWVTQPTAINGPIDFIVWLSSDDPPPSFSGVGVGVAILDQGDQVVGGYVYSHSYARGKILTATPTAYAFRVNFDRRILRGQKLVFAVGVGSTSLAWRMKVYFDNQQYASRATLPSSVIVIPEFLETAVLITVVMFLLSLTKEWAGIPARRKTLASDRIDYA